MVVIFQENHSFDSYFATYPVAANPPGQPAFSPRPGTSSVNGLTETLLRHNPNESNPFRIDRLLPSPATKTMNTPPNSVREMEA
jgi:phospholipase C